MLLRVAALAALALASCLPGPARARDSLSLDDAFVRVARTHPDLRLFGPRTAQLLAEQAQAQQRPPLRLTVEVEGVLGSGEWRGADAAETTVGLAGVFERGGKLDARRTLAQRRIDALAVEREASRLDLLAETARRHLAVQAAQAEADIAREDIDQRQRAVAAARQRLQVGASPESVLLAAQAALARAELDEARAEQQRHAARQHLAALWNQRAPDFGDALGSPLALPAPPEPDALVQLLQDTPELAAFADAGRIAEARLQLARSEATPDLDWQLGVRRQAETGDVGLVASLSLPLGTAGRAAAGVRAAQAGLALLEVERESREIALHGTLVEAAGRYRVSHLQVQRLGSEVLPRLQRAEQAAERAYRAGATSYLDWSQLQAARIDGLRDRLAAAVEAQRALIELQRLTGRAVVPARPVTFDGDRP